MYQTCCWFCDDIWWMEDSFHLFRKFLITGLWCSHIQQCCDIWHWIFEGPKDQGEGTCYTAFHRSLSNLDCQYLDLYLIHWPGTQGRKPDDPDQGELRVGSWRDLIKLQKEGICICMTCLHGISAPGYIISRSSVGTLTSPVQSNSVVCLYVKIATLDLHVH